MGIACHISHDRFKDQEKGQYYNVINYRKQDFEMLKADCLKKKVLFEDPVFPALPTSLGFKDLGPSSKLVQNISWKRPTVSTGKDARGFWVRGTVVPHPTLFLHTPPWS